ncbi:response regulator [Sediminibacterium sp.]|uniref:response regulator n=1 Tax=Sediminibacterium sp. TaxID=1917865 RepID=UPI003F71B8C2
MTDSNHKYKILIADDDEINRVILKHMLKSLDVDINSACDGLEVMEYLKIQEGKVILLLDLNMPNMDGTEVITAINNNLDLSKRVKIIVITANLLSGFMGDDLNSRVLACFEKPVGREELINTINIGVGQLN